MKDTTTYSQYIQLRNSGYYFRYTIPARLRPHIQRRELKYSLRTRNKKTAKHRAARLAALLYEVFESMSGRELTPKKIRELVHKELGSWLRNHKEWELDDPVYTPEQAEKLARAHEHMARQYRQALATNDYEIVRDKATALLSKHGITIPSEILNPLAIPHEGSQEGLQLYRRVARELAEANVFFFDALADRHRGITQYGLETSYQGIKLDADSAPLLSTLWNSYTHTKKVKKEWSDSTRNGQDATFKEFLGVVGDKPVNEVGRDDILQYLSALQQLPKASLSRYKGKSIVELLEIETPQSDLRSSRTVSEALARISSFFKWCHKEEQAIRTNPTDGITFQSRSTSREPFSQEDLEKLFYSQAYKEGTHRKSWQFWMPLLALYTGARQNELAQLTLKDIIEIEGIPAIDINDTELDQSIKTDAGYRQVPIHHELINIGFLDYVQALRSKDEERLFPDLHRGTRRWGQAVSQWWNREDSHSQGYMLKCGVDKAGGKKVFHSFRNTVITQLLRVAKAPLNEVQFLVGHERSMMGATSNYFRGSFSDSVGVIKQLDFGLNHLKIKNQWIVYIDANSPP